VLQFQQTFPAKAIFITFFNECALFGAEGNAVTLALHNVAGFAFKGTAAARTFFFFVFTHGVVAFEIVTGICAAGDRER